MQTTLYHGRTEAGRAVEVEVRGERIARITPLVDAPDRLPLFLPVLVDLQHNGALGAYYGELSEIGAGKLREIAALLRRRGVGRCLLTLVTQAPSELDRIGDFLRETLDADPALARLYFGIFHEGVFISPKEGWRGAHALPFIAPPDWGRLQALDERTGGRIALINVAPEEAGGLAFIERAVAAGKKVALGHCCPSERVIEEAITRGASMVTHFGNGASARIHRFENPFWSFLDRDELMLGLICDGFHLPGAVVRTALRCKGRERCLPVSDASGCSGLPPGKYSIVSRRRIEITPSGRVQMEANPEILAGGWFQQDRSVETLVREAGFTFSDAWNQCSRVPARAIGIRLPELAVGEEASFVLARWEEGVVIEQSVHAGRPEPLHEPAEFLTGGAWFGG